MSVVLSYGETKIICETFNPIVVLNFKFVVVGDNVIGDAFVSADNVDFVRIDSQEHLIQTVEEHRHMIDNFCASFLLHFEKIFFHLLFAGVEVGYHAEFNYRGL